MLVKIAVYTESQRPPVRLAELRARLRQPPPNTAADAIASVVEAALETVPCAAVFVPTQTGTTARMISRLNPAPWIVALSCDASVCQGLAFSSGVEPVLLAGQPENWREFAQAWFLEHHTPAAFALLVAGPSAQNPEANYRLEVLKVAEFPTDRNIGELVPGRSHSPLTETDVVAR